MKLLKFLTFLVFLEVIECKFESTAVEIEGVLDQCCKINENDSSFKSCHDFTKTVDTKSISFVHKNLCETNLEFCCQKSRQAKECEEGKNKARLTGKCDTNDRSESEMFKLCCLSCAVGREIAKLNGKCISFQTQSYYEKVQSECCEKFQGNFQEFFELESPVQVSESRNSVEDNENEIDDDDESSDKSLEDSICPMGNKCEHDCELRNDRALCLCNDGFKLAENGFSCTKIAQCGNGFEFNKISRDCDDIDECLLNDPCSITENCINVKGSFSCQKKICIKGYQINNNTGNCDDIDECASKTSCPITDRCINHKGSYSCHPVTCSKGYQVNYKTKTCDDINECLTNPCKKSEICINFPGSFDCDCAYGYRKDFYSKTHCRDIDECQEHPGICEQSCKNTVGSYRCSCFKGYKMNADNKTCSDFDECEHKKYSSVCLGPATCKNTLGGYRCMCPKGFEMNSRNYCEDIDECKQGKSICSGKDETCLNIYGSYKCNRKPQCDDGYRRMKNGVCRLRNLELCDEGTNSETNEIEKPCKIPMLYDYNFGTIISNRSIPKGGYGFIRYQFNIKRNYSLQVQGLKVNYAANGVQIADESFFDFQKSPNEVFMKLVKPIDGPQEIEIEFWIRFTAGQNNVEEVRGQRVVIFVSEHSFS